MIPGGRACRFFLFGAFSCGPFVCGSWLVCGLGDFPGP